MKTIFSISTLALAAGLAGCAVGPDYHRPSASPGEPPAKTFSDGSTNQVVWKVAEPSASAPRGEWWQIFEDAELNRLETLAATNNQSLVAAAARFEQSRLLVASARSQFFPQLSAGGTPGGDVNRQSTDGGTALLAAAANDRREVMEVLLDNGADPNLADSSGKTPISVNHNSEVEALLRKHGAK